MRQGNLEIEIRFKVGDIDELRKKLRRLGSKCLERWKGRDILFDKNNELVPRGKVLRLRLGMEKSGKGKLTYKEPNQLNRSPASVFKIREEFETIVEKPKMAIRILEGLGYLPIIQYEKRTELWKYRGTEIYIEQLPKIGCFMEIEGSEKNIEKVALILEFDITKGIRKSYREYFMELSRKREKWFF